ncbi:MAG: hypothetical protein K6T76_09125 [Alicyclobacillus mali]|uniref:hypothetical protein n=1 Tax=Alicyclobacillus mali (ex Roth et al. 2021) TaxID=1123961 RepID=UPI0023F3AD6A|nr:hypothetical protein [Alicyclobacillus mali (ex Roth et al. 2021)]MCL6489081.1 hypothetical protein [Alicyclobacillus mali (ex Roth et al. 2021)]
MDKWIAGGLLIIGVLLLVAFVHPYMGKYETQQAQGEVQSNQQMLNATAYAQYSNQTSCAEAGGQWNAVASTCQP